MRGKMDKRININGIDVDAHYSEESINRLFIPLLKRLSALHTAKGRRILVMLSAPPGAGKSTLVSFLADLAGSVIPEKRVQAVGMDGFHRRQEYLVSHTAQVDGREVPMVKIKGAPVTFDLEALERKITEVKASPRLGWPHYDRLLHNPVEDAIFIDGDIVLLEGNYLLLDMDGWRELASHADYTISLWANENLLRDRLVERKIATGVERAAAEEFVDFSDMANVRLCLQKTMRADLEIELSRDGTEFNQRENIETYNPQEIIAV